ncbi:MAG: hypothetical protein WBE42_28095, partial [Pseudolabrys sp.]
VYTGRNPFISFQSNAITGIKFIASKNIGLTGTVAGCEFLREFLMPWIGERRHIQIPISGYLNSNLEINIPVYHNQSYAIC